MMTNRRVAVVATLFFAAGITGCSNQPAAERDEGGQITVDDASRTADNVECTQVNWHLLIKSTAGPAQAHASLQLGENPTVKTVNIANFDGFNGVVGGDEGDADVSVDGGTYTIRGTAEGSHPDKPGESRTARFQIVAPC